MSQTGIHQFGRLLLTDQNLQNQFARGIAAGKAQDLAALCALGRRFGCEFTESEARALLIGLGRSANTASSGEPEELSDDDLERVAGGTGRTAARTAETARKTARAAVSVVATAVGIATSSTGVGAAEATTESGADVKDDAAENSNAVIGDVIDTATDVIQDGADAAENLIDYIEIQSDGSKSDGIKNDSQSEAGGDNAVDEAIDWIMGGGSDDDSSSDDDDDSGSSDDDDDDNIFDVVVDTVTSGGW